MKDNAELSGASRIHGESSLMQAMPATALKSNVELTGAPLAERLSGTE